MDSAALFARCAARGPVRGTRRRALAPETANTSDALMYETKFGVELGCLSRDGQMIARRLLGSDWCWNEASLFVLQALSRC